MLVTERTCISCPCLDYTSPASITICTSLLQGTSRISHKSCGCIIFVVFAKRVTKQHCSCCESIFATIFNYSVCLLLSQTYLNVQLIGLSESQCRLIQFLWFNFLMLVMLLKYLYQIMSYRYLTLIVVSKL